MRDIDVKMRLRPNQQQTHHPNGTGPPMGNGPQNMGHGPPPHLQRSMSTPDGPPNMGNGGPPMGNGPQNMGNNGPPMGNGVPQNMGHGPSTHLQRSLSTPNGPQNMGNGGPPMGNGPQNMGHGPPSNYDAQTAMRVRRWIESKTVTNVADCRPYLNAEIQQGLVLKKPTSMNDRSAPRF